MPHTPHMLHLRMYLSTKLNTNTNPLINPFLPALSRLSPCSLRALSLLSSCSLLSSSYGKACGGGYFPPWKVNADIFLRGGMLLIGSLAVGALITVIALILDGVIGGAAWSAVFTPLWCVFLWLALYQIGLKFKCRR